MIVKLNTETINTIADGLMSGIIDKVTIEPRSKSKKGVITFFVFYETYSDGKRDPVTPYVTDAVKVLLTFWDKNVLNQVDEFTFKKNGSEPIAYKIAYNKESPSSSAISVAAQLKGILDASKEVGDIPLLNNTKLSIRNAMDNIYNTLLSNSK